MKVIINESSTLLSNVTTGTGKTEVFDSQETSECSERPSHCFQGSSWTARGRKKDWHGGTIACTPKESCVNKRHCTFVVAPGAQRFHPERDLCRVARRRGSHAGCRQTAESSRCVYTEQLSVILSCPHRTWNLLRSTVGAFASSRRSSQTGKKANGTWRSHGSATLTRHSTKSETLCSETMSLGARERMARKPVLRSACRVSSVTPGRRWEICRTTSGPDTRA